MILSADTHQDERSSRLLDALPAIAWSASVETFCFTYVNRAAETLLGYPIERWLQEPDFWSAHLHPEDRHVPMLCHHETLAGRNHELEYRMIAADGRTVWLRDYVHVHMVEGRAMELFGVMVDVTREREAEAASRENRENFRRMVELSPDCIGVHVDETYVYVNQAFVQLIGAKSEAEIVGQNVYSIVDAAYHPAARDRLERLRTGTSVPYEREQYRRADGSLLDVEVAALPLRYGNRDAVQIIARDVTPLRQAERMRAAAEAKFRWLVEQSVVAVYMTSGRRLTYINDTGARMVGYEPDELTSMDITKLFIEEDRPTSMVDGAPSVARVRRKDGTIVHLAFYQNEIHVDGEKIIIGTSADITESLRAQQALEESKRMSSLGQVAASLAHEFNNVLMGIQPFVEVISRNAPATRPVNEAVGHITRAITRGKRASQEILRFANPKAPQLFAIDVQVWLPTILGQLVAALPSSIALSSSMEPGVRFIRGDAEHLEQVITNLVFNARDAIGGTGTIHVAISFDGVVAEGEADFVRISVRDDGPGIPPNALEQIFEPLFTTKRNGTGLGLAIARRLMEGQGGTLTVENRPERGCVFHLLVPAAEMTTIAMQPVTSATPGVKRILIVEDDMSVGAGLEALLTAEGYETTWVRAAGDACEAAQGMRPHVAIVDVNLPDGSGVDLIPLLRAQHRDLPIVLSTGHVELDFASQTSRVLSLMKPYELDTLLVAIASVTATAVAAA
jgi:PAS domain S-box-containing protein